MKEFKTRRDISLRLGILKEKVEAPQNKNPIKSLASELGRAYSLARRGKEVPTFDALLVQLVSQYFSGDKEIHENREEIVKETSRIARQWTLPEITGPILPDPRRVAMDSITKEEAEELRKPWGTYATPQKGRGGDPFRSLLISCRALLFIERYPALYIHRKKAKTIGTPKY